MKKFFSFDVEPSFVSSNSSKVDVKLSDHEPVHPSNSRVLTGFLLLNSMIGSGILNQPQVFMESGIFAALIMFSIASCFIWLGLSVLISSGIKSSIYDYSELASHCYGIWGAKVVDISIVIGNFGALLSYVDIIGITASDLIISWGCSNPSACEPYLITVVIFFVLVFPVCLKRHFGELAIFSVFSMTAIVVILMLVIIAGPLESVPGQVQALSSGFGSQLGSIIFALSCAFAAFPAYKSMADKSLYHWRRVTAITILIGLTLLIAMGLAGYLSFKQQTNGLILNNFVGHYADFFKLVLIIHLILYIPVEYMILRHSLLKFFGLESGQFESFTAHALISFLILAVAVIIILLLRAQGLTQGAVFGLILDFTGGFVGSITSFIIPAAVYLKLMPVAFLDDPSYPACVVMLVFGVFVAIYVPVVSVINAA